ncbi:MAG TPA: polysaccharide biosynthesis tyrosine autokinase [Caldilineaceae bacterium]|nr:polysaccharide biosynthesis tyrosine autokinase [Caldilineaceae bacterium]
METPNTPASNTPSATGSVIQVVAPTSGQQPTLQLMAATAPSMQQPFPEGILIHRPPTPASSSTVQGQEKLIDLKVYGRLIWHWLWLIIACTMLAGIGGYVFSILSIPIYQASATVLIDQARNSSTSYQDLLSSERIARTYAELMQRESMMEKVAARFGIDLTTLNDVVTDVSVTPLRDTQLIRVTIEGISPEFVAAVADTLPKVFIDEIGEVQTQRFDDSKRSLEQQLNSLSGEIELHQIAIDEIGQSRTAEEELRLGQLRNELVQYQNSYANLLRSYEELRLTEVQSMDSIVVVSTAKLPQEPIRPQTLLNTLILAVIGGALALGTIFLIDYLDDRVKSPQDLHAVVNTPILGTIARMQRERGRLLSKSELSREEGLITEREPRHPITEAYRSLRTNLQFSNVDEALHSFLVTSATPGEGKTTTASNVAVVLAQSGRSVILIDADIRKPQQHKIFGHPKMPGLTDALLAGSAPLEFFVRETSVPNLRILTAGKDAPNPAELLGSHRMQTLVKQLEQMADVLVFDAPPLLAVTDAQVLAKQTQGVLLVVNTEKTPRAMVARAAESLERANVRLFGAVLNRLARSARSYYYYYDSYAYYYEDDGDDNQKPPRKQKRKQTADKRGDSRQSSTPEKGEASGLAPAFFDSKAV